MTSRLSPTSKASRGASVAADDDLRERIDDVNGVRTAGWIYNDIEKAREQTRQEDKPLFDSFGDNQMRQ